MKKGLAEGETLAAPEAYRTEDDTRFGLYVTATGLAAIGIDDGAATSDGAAAAPTAAGAETSSPAVGAAPSATKAAAVLALLQRENGATLAALVETTGWLPHTMRAAMTGLRKKGHTLERYKRDAVTCHRIAEAA